MTSTGSGSAYSPMTSKPAGSVSASSSRGELADPRPQPLDVAAVERPGHEPAQPGVLGRLVLHHLVAVEQVERLEVVGRLLVPPDPAHPAVPQHRAGRGVVEGQTLPGRLVPRHRVRGALLGEERVGVRDDVGSRQVKRGRRRPKASGSTSLIGFTPVTVHSSISGPPFSHSSWRHRPHGMITSPLAFTQTTWVSLPPPVMCSWETIPHSAHRATPYAAFSTLQPVRRGRRRPARPPRPCSSSTARRRAPWPRRPPPGGRPSRSRRGRRARSTRAPLAIDLAVGGGHS